jgi:hypothetical protein
MQGILKKKELKKRAHGAMTNNRLSSPARTVTSSHNLQVYFPHSQSVL